MASLVISGDIQAPRAIPGEGELQPRQYPGDVEIPNRVFVKGFSRETTEEELKIFFEEFGIVRESKIVKDKTGISKGYAFITFDSQQVAEDVKQKEVVKYNQKDLVLGPARIRKKRPIFRARPDLWPGTPVAGNMIQQVPVYYQVSPDGAWYFQQPMQSPSNTQMAISLVPTTSQVPYLANQSTYPTQQQLQLQQLQLQTQLAATHLGQNVYPTVTQASPAGPTYPMSNLNLGEMIKMTKRPSSSLMPIQTTPPSQESPEYTISGGNISPAQCVPVYDGNFVSDEASLSLAGSPEVKVGMTSAFYDSEHP